MIWSEIKLALNQTLGTKKLKTLDRIVEEESYKAFFKIAELDMSGNVFVPKVDGDAYYGEGPDSPATAPIIVIPIGVKILGSYAIPATTQKLFLPPSLEKIGSSSIYIDSMNYINIPKSVKEISSVAFIGTKDITISVPWQAGEVSGAPWGANNAKIIYEVNT